MGAVASPEYFASRPIPGHPRDLMNHRCINQRMPTSGGLYVWDFEQRGKQVNVRVDGQLIFNTSTHIVQAAVAGLGIAYLPEEEFEPYLQEGRLVRVLEAWCPPFSGYYLYYPSRRQPSPAFTLVANALRKDAQGDASKPLPAGP
jgi:DNA-binding transcriptional LysR family regulator